MLKIKNYILLALFSLISISAMAQRPTINVTVQPSDIMIGEQAVINLEVISPLGKDIRFPVYQDTIIKGIEVLRMEKVDTLLNEVMTLRQQYLVTSFDSTLYYVPGMMIVVDGKDSIMSEGFGLKVNSPQLSEQTAHYLDQLNNNQVDSIDFEQLELADIKDIQSPPFVLMDYLFYVLIFLLICLVIAGIVGGIYFWKKKRKKGYFFAPKVVEPPHIVALRELNKVKDKKMGQRGMEKEYYTEVTDILRVYISNRYPSINATEMITEDILEAVHRQTDNTSPEEGLEQVLKLADLVKFAKYTPLPDENDLSMVNSLLFVNQTKQEIVETPEDLKAKSQQEKVEERGKEQSTEGDNKETTNSKNE